MGNKISEKSIVDASLRWLRKLPECKARKRRGGVSNKGHPDIYGSIFGIHFEIEVKAPGNKPTKLQKVRLDEWDNAGAITGVSYSLDETKSIIFNGLLKRTEVVKIKIIQFLSKESGQCLKYIS